MNEAYGELEKRRNGEVSLKAAAEPTARAAAHSLLGSSMFVKLKLLSASFADFR